MRCARHATALLIAVGLMAGAAGVHGAERAGVAAAVVGDATVRGKPREEPVSARTGMDILRFDRVITRPKARMQILLLNRTTFSIGPKSEVVVNDFVYEPDKGVVSITASFVKGVFRYIAGTADKLEKRSVRIETAIAEIGVRGTSVFLYRAGNESRIFAGLLGPGPTNTAAMRRGGFVASNDRGRTRVVRAGYGVILQPGQPPSDPVPIPEELVRIVQRGLQGTPGGEPGGGAGPDDAEKAARQPDAEAREAAREAGEEAGDAAGADAVQDKALDAMRSGHTLTKEAVPQEPANQNQ